MRLVAQHPPDDGEQPGQRAVLGDPARRPRPGGRARPAAGRPSRRARRSVRPAAPYGRRRPARCRRPALPRCRPARAPPAGCPGTLPPRSASTSRTSKRRPSAAARSRLRSAAGPLPAAETSTSGSAASAAASDSAKMRWSSTTRTRIRTTKPPSPSSRRAGDTHRRGDDPRRADNPAPRDGARSRAARPPPCKNCYPHFGRRTRLSRPLISTGPHRCCSSGYGRGAGAEGNLQNWLAGAFMVSRMFRLETEVDKDWRDLLRSRLRETNTAASPMLRALRGTPGERELPLHVWALDAPAPWRADWSATPGRPGCT